MTRDKIGDHTARALGEAANAATNANEFSATEIHRIQDKIEELIREQGEFFDGDSEFSKDPYEDFRKHVVTPLEAHLLGISAKTATEEYEYSAFSQRFPATPELLKERLSGSRVQQAAGLEEDQDIHAEFRPVLESAMTAITKGTQRFVDELVTAKKRFAGAGSPD